MTVLTVLIVIATVLGAGMIVPQVLRLRRMRTLAGVSLLWIGLSAALNGWWIAYGIGAGRWGVVPVSVGGLLLYLWMAGLAAQIAGPAAWRPMALGALVPTAAAGAGLLVGGWSVAGLVIGLSYGIQFGPAVCSALRSDRLDGVSPTTWIMAWVEAAIWLLYGLDVGDLPLLVGGGGGAAMATIILLRLVLHDRRPRTVGRGQVVPLAT